MGIKRLGIYVHIPFCVSKCAYCDFFSAPAGDEVKRDYINALCRQIESEASKLAHEYEVDSIFFGGGTPSILEAAQLTSVLGKIRQNFMVSDHCEITVECNPGTVDRNLLKTYRDNGVNRLSFGLQSVNDDELKALGRIHTFRDFMVSYENALGCGFANINIDIMSAIPGQTVAGWKKTLRTVAALRPAHISVYSLMLEEGTPLYERYESGEDLRLPGEDEERAIYYATGEILELGGYEHYEISNYAVPGKKCRHNIKYWTRGEYLGLGAGASSLIRNRRFTAVRDINRYIEAPDGCYEDVEELGANDCMSEFMFLGLRMMRGVSRDSFRLTFGRQLDNVFGDIIKKYTATGHISDDGQRIRLTAKGIDVSNYILADFLL